MKRKIIKIDEDKCNGCGLCIPNCMEGALQIIDDKARLISDLFCDGLGACIGFCPEGAIAIEEREAVPYDEMLVIKTIASQGENTLIAHLDHLLEHGEISFLAQAVEYIEMNNLNMNLEKYLSVIPGKKEKNELNNIATTEFACGCSGVLQSHVQQDKVPKNGEIASEHPGISGLQQWPVQLHLLNPMASFFKDSDLILTADCVAFAAGNFHSKYLKSKTLAIACPKLDHGVEKYIEKMALLLKTANLRSFHVIRMEVPCCGGLTQIARLARENSGIDIPIIEIVIGTKGELLHQTTI